MRPVPALDEKDLIEQFSRSSGPGGQHVNKSHTRVQLTHRPTGISVTVQDTRYREKNRTLARARLLEQINRQRESALQEKIQEREKRRRRTRPRPRGLKERILQSKKQRAQIKANRHKPEF